MKRSLMIGFAAVTIAGFSPSARGSWLADITGINIGQCSVLIQNNTGRPLSFEISGNQSTWTKMTATTGLAADVCLARQADKKTGDIFVRIATNGPAPNESPKIKTYRLLFDRRYEFMWNASEKVWDVSLIVPRKSP
jgi:hypothetical protein